MNLRRMMVSFLNALDCVTKYVKYLRSVNDRIL